MKDRFTVSGYHITTDPKFQNKRYGVTPELERMFNGLFVEIYDKHNKKTIDKLTQLILKYPRVPVLKNYLMAVYEVRGEHKKAIEVNEWILSEHPDYLFGLLNKANKFIEEAEYSKVPEILCEAMEIKALYQDRDLFHIAEFTGFLKTAIRYYAAIKNQDLAENRFEILQEIAPDHPDTEQAETFLFDLGMKKAMARYAEEEKVRITPIQKKYSPDEQKTKAPTFNHPEIQNLYHFGLDIPKEKLLAILALPHASLVEDLEKVLVDAVKRYDYFNSRDWEDETHNFVLHAFFLLKEVKAVESLPKILSFLEYDEGFLDFWLGDHISENLWQCIYALGFDNTSILRDFLLLPGVYTYSKTAVSEALCQMVLYHPEKRNEVQSIYAEVFTAFSDATLEDNLIDSSFLGLSIGDTLNCNLHELLPSIEVLFDKGYVSFSISGNYSDVAKEFAQPSERARKRTLNNIFEFYESIL
ncbi:MAG: DUF1186 domain-containing protein [Chitinophagaceae bacterium]